jgi:hypothetical protein
MLVYAPLLWVTDRHTQIALACAGIVLDLSRVDYIVINLYGRFGRWRRRERTTTGLGEGEGQGERQGLLSMPRLKDDLRLPGTSVIYPLQGHHFGYIGRDRLILCTINAAAVAWP